MNEDISEGERASPEKSVRRLLVSLSISYLSFLERATNLAAPPTGSLGLASTL